MSDGFSLHDLEGREHECRDHEELHRLLAQASMDATAPDPVAHSDFADAIIATIEEIVARRLMDGGRPR